MNMRFRAACRGLAALVLALCFAAAPAGAADAGKSYVNGIDANYPPSVSSTNRACPRVSTWIP